MPNTIVSLDLPSAKRKVTLEQLSDIGDACDYRLTLVYSPDNGPSETLTEDFFDEVTDAKFAFLSECAQMMRQC